MSDNFDGKSIGWWFAETAKRLGCKKKKPLSFVSEALKYYPTDPELLHNVVFAALVEEKPADALRYLKRLGKRYELSASDTICNAIALAQQQKYHRAQSLLKTIGIISYSSSSRCNIFIPHAKISVPPGVDFNWIGDYVESIVNWEPAQPKVQRGTKKVRINAKSPQKVVELLTDSKKTDSKKTDSTTLIEQKSSCSELTRLESSIPVTYNMPIESDYAFLAENPAEKLNNYMSRLELAHLSLFRGFDELLCLSHLDTIEKFNYQIESARKVLKHFRGRVLLSDEVGLGKTVEACIVLKEYLMRGMVQRFLILTPPSLVGQWSEELETKFGISSVTTSSSLVRKDSKSFWAQPNIVASIATAKRPAHLETLVSQNFDIVIVDEAHHLKNRRTKNWQLVDGLKKRFLLLLSATPVQNNLIELYNLLTLLKPGIFKTEKEFRLAYMRTGNPRVPKNRENLHALMRDVMIRNTRALVDVALPPRHATTIQVEPTQEESLCYAELNRLLRLTCSERKGKERLFLHHLLGAAGSSPKAAAKCLEGLANRIATPEWTDLCDRYTKLKHGAKTDALLKLLEKNRGEKNMVFVVYRETLNELSSILTERGISHVCFHGQLSASQKDKVVEQFRTNASVLLCTESGGEGKNMQFCNTVINFDLPWNPQAIEQRIGRVHRIGQERDVFVFNLSTKGTIEEVVLKILDEKINMFRLVVGEVQSLLGEMQEEGDFASVVFSAWIQTTEEERDLAFERIGEQLLDVKNKYEETKSLDEQLFGEEFEVA